MREYLRFFDFNILFCLFKAPVGNWWVDCDLTPPETVETIKTLGVSVVIDINKINLQQKEKSGDKEPRVIMQKLEENTDETTQITSDLFLRYMDKFGVIKNEEGHFAGMVYECYRDNCDLWEILGVLTEHYFNPNSQKTRKVLLKYGLPLKEAMTRNNKFTLPDMLSLICNIYSSVNRKQRDNKILESHCGYLPRCVDVQDMIVRINNDATIKSYVKKQCKDWEIKRIDLSTNCMSLLQDVQFNTMLDGSMQQNVDKETYLDNVVAIRKYSPYVWFFKTGDSMLDIVDNEKLLTSISQYPPVMFAEINKSNVIVHLGVGEITEISKNNIWDITITDRRNLSHLNIEIPQDIRFVVFHDEIWPKLNRHQQTDLVEMFQQRTKNIPPDIHGKPYILADTWWQCPDDFKNNDIYAMTIDEIKKVEWDAERNDKKVIMQHTTLPLINNLYAYKMLLQSIFVKPTFKSRFVELITNMVQDVIVPERISLQNGSDGYRLKVWFYKWKDTLSEQNPSFTGE